MFANNTHSIKLTHLFIITVLIVIWLLTLIVFILYLPSNSFISPAVWLHGTAILLLLFIIKRFGYEIKTSLAIYAVNWKWILGAFCTAIIYWLIDHWLMSNVFGVNSEAAIKSWQIANSRYHIFTVFLSSVILAPLFEELFFRGLIFNQLSKNLSVWLSALISALFFAGIHWSWPEFISLFLAGMIYAYLLRRSNSLLTPLIAHTIHNFITFLYYF